MSQLGKKSVLLVEDEALISMTEKMQLEKYGYAVRTATTGEKAVEAVETSSDIDLILMDINLGDGIDGTEAAEIILKDHDIPVVFLSSHTEPEIVEKTERITSYGFVVKNSSATVLDASIKMAFKLFDALAKEQIREESLRQSEQKYKTLFNEMLDGFALHEIICDSSGTPVDYRFLDVNPVFERMTGLKATDIVGRTVLEVLPGTEKYWIDTYGRVALSGEPIVFENYAAVLGKYFIVSAVRPAANHFACVFEDVTERKQAETRLAENVKLLSRAQEIARIGYWQLDLTKNLLSWSDEVYRIFGCEPQEFDATYEAFLDFVHPDDRTAVDDAYSRSLREGSDGYEIEHRIVRRDSDDVRYVHERCDHERDEAGTIIQSTGMVQDITERKRVEEDLRRFKTSSDNAVYGKAIADLQGNLLYINRFFANIHGYEPEDLIGEHFSLFHSEQQMDAADSLIASMLQDGRFKPTTIWHCHKDGTEFPMLMSGIVLKDDSGSPQYIAASAVDVTERNRLEQELTSQKQYLETILETTSQGFWVVTPDGKITDVNAAYCRLSGYTKDELTGMEINDLDAIENPQETAERVKRIMENGSETFETKHRRKDGSLLDVEISVSRLDRAEGVSLVCFCRDIGKRKQWEKALAQKSRLLEESQVLANLGSWEWDIEHDAWHFSEQWRKIHGISENDLTTPKLFEIAHPEDAPDIERAFTDARKRGKTYDIEHRIIRADDKEIRHIKALGEVEFDQETGRPVRMVGAAQDITERKQAENEIRQLLAEKETLIKEIQHRIKNNINTMASLLSLQAQTLEEPTAIAALEDARNRLDSLAVLYDHLYAADARKKGSLQEYLRRLVVSEVGVFPHGNQVEVHSEIEECMCATRTLSTLGLIVNELVTNAMKYAFRDHPNPKLTLTGVHCDEHYILTVEDNGSGMIEPDESQYSSGFGFMLVNTLTQQLDGTIRFENDNGTRVEIEFPITENE